MDQEDAQLVRRIEPSSTAWPIMPVRLIFASQITCAGHRLLGHAASLHHGFIGTTKRHATSDTSADKTLPAITLGEDLCQKDGKRVARKRARKNVAIDSVFKTHEQQRKGSCIKEAAYILRHSGDCHERHTRESLTTPCGRTFAISCSAGHSTSWWLDHRHPPSSFLSGTAACLWDPEVQRGKARSARSAPAQFEGMRLASLLA